MPLKIQNKITLTCREDLRRSLSKKKKKKNKKKKQKKKKKQLFI